MTTNNITYNMVSRINKLANIHLYTIGALWLGDSMDIILLLSYNNKVLKEIHFNFVAADCAPVDVLLSVYFYMLMNNKC
jgi:hypothetical protein